MADRIGPRLPGESARAYAVLVHDRDIVWLTDFGANANVSLDPLTGQFETYPLEEADTNVRQLPGRPGEVWCAGSGSDTLIVVRMD